MIFCQRGKVRVKFDDTQLGLQRPVISQTVSCVFFTAPRAFYDEQCKRDTHSRWSRRPSSRSFASRATRTAWGPSLGVLRSCVTGGKHDHLINRTKAVYTNRKTNQSRTRGEFQKRLEVVQMGRSRCLSTASNQDEKERDKKKRQNDTTRTCIFEG